mmetsp:Transcript_28618/g.52230  ORF Transcript_28618/g.52230 Transcript_28618/m.52230 type:complete len:203 (-) Transcript_28618:1286-1894(-)
MAVVVTLLQFSDALLARFEETVFDHAIDGAASIVVREVLLLGIIIVAIASVKVRRVRATVITARRGGSLTITAVAVAIIAARTRKAREKPIHWKHLRLARCHRGNTTTTKSTIMRRKDDGSIERSGKHQVSPRRGGRQTRIRIDRVRIDVSVRRGITKHGRSHHRPAVVVVATVIAVAVVVVATIAILSTSTTRGVILHPGG